MSHYLPVWVQLLIEAKLVTTLKRLCASLENL
jgi:hypothetical protein